VYEAQPLHPALLKIVYRGEPGPSSPYPPKAASYRTGRRTGLVKLAGSVVGSAISGFKRQPA